MMMTQPNQVLQQIAHTSVSAAAAAAAWSCQPWPRRGSCFCIMSGGLLKALRSDSYVELSEYRDQHFRVRRAGHERGSPWAGMLRNGLHLFYTVSVSPS